MQRDWRYWGFLLGITAVLCGFLLPWTNHPTAGLRLIGLEFSEWAKFLPQVQEGRTPNRDLIYLPPIMLGAILALWTAFWPARWQTWAMRGVAFRRAASLASRSVEVSTIVNRVLKRQELNFPIAVLNVR